MNTITQVIAILLGLVWAGMALALSRNAVRQSGPLNLGSRFRLWFPVVVLGWYGLSLLLALNGFYARSDRFSEGDVWGFLTFATLMSLPVVGLLLANTRWPAFQKFMGSIRPDRLIGVQVYRVLGVIFLTLVLDGKMPAPLALTGVLDLTIGLSAPVVAWGVQQHKAWARPVARVWNGLGLFDFIYAISFVALTSPAPVPLLRVEPVPVLMGFYPLVFIALVAVPVSIFLHLLSLRSLRTATGRADTAAFMNPA